MASVKFEIRVVNDKIRTVVIAPDGASITFDSGEREIANIIYRYRNALEEIRAKDVP